jgi:4-hydroxy-3-polyprenylbenzoate decarboxylase
MQEKIRDLRGTIEFLKKEGELIEVEGEVDPIYEIAGIQKAFENGPVLLFKNIKGYPNVRNIGNLFSNVDRAAKIFDVENPRKLKFKCLEAVKKPISPKGVGEAPCQEVIIQTGIDVMGTLPIIKHTERDGGRILGGGIIFASGIRNGGTELCFKRMNFRGKDWGSLFIGMPTHLGLLRYTERRGQEIPLTINIGTPPAVSMVAGAAFPHSIVPYGSDELAIAGGLQGFPVEICKAKTVDAYAIANSEWVIEGILTNELVWETDESENMDRARTFPFFPEWPGYLGSAMKAPKFKVTAITHRKDKPTFYTPLARSYECGLGHPFTEACFFELAERMNLGFVKDVHIPDSLLWGGGLVFQVRKRGMREEGYQKMLLMNVLGDSFSAYGLRLVMVVDDDVDIYNADDLLWAFATRVEPNKDIVRGPTGIGRISFQPQEGAGGTIQESVFEGPIGIDATVPLQLRKSVVFERAHYPVDRIDLRKWFTQDQIKAAVHMQSEYARLVAKKGW